MCVAGHAARFAVAQFGHKVSNGPLWVITNTVCSYASKVQEVDADAFVDDLFNCMATQAHKACGGLKGRCLVCLTALERATLKMKFMYKMMKDCGLEYSDKGDMTIRRIICSSALSSTRYTGNCSLQREKSTRR
jgi:hypothetical protein